MPNWFEGSRAIQGNLGYGLAMVLTGLTAGMVAYMFTKKRPKSIKSAVDLCHQSVEVEPGVFASVHSRDGSLIEYLYEDAQTIYESLVRGLCQSKGGDFLGTRTGPNKEYEWITYQQVYDRAQHFGSALLAKGLSAGQESFVGIYAANRPEWVITNHAAQMYSMVTVPLYDTLGKDACTYIINQIGMRVVVCDTNEKAQKILQSVDTASSIKLLVIMEDVSNNNCEAGEKHGIELTSFTEMESIGMENVQDVQPPKPSDLALICYTSGTTGNPKGVMLSHRNLVSNIGGCFANNQMKFTAADVHISYLPLAHMFEYILEVYIAMCGCKIGFFGGDVRGLIEDIATLKPTLFPCVPRVLNRLYDKVLTGVRSSRVKSALFNLALRKKTALLKQGIITRSTIWDKLVFSKIQNLLGGRVSYMVTGSAPLSEEVLTFIRCAMGCPVVEGYGQTEAAACITMSVHGDSEAGHVGPPVACNLVKLVDVPDMEYYAANGQGEVCVKGTNIMSGYFKDAERTREALDNDGWLHTGDVGQWLPNGTLKIINRKKHIFKLAQGEYVAPEKIETIYTRSSLVTQAFVDGDSLKTYTVAVIVPDPEVVPQWAKQQGIMGSMEELCQNETVQEAVLKDIRKEGQSAGLKGFEQVRKVHLYPELFSVQNGLLTPTFKSKRPALRKMFGHKIAEMYTES